MKIATVLEKAFPFVLLVVAILALVGLQAAPTVSLTLSINDVLSELAGWSGHLAWIVGLMLLDVILGIAKALRTKTFMWERLTDFYVTMVLPMVLGFAGVVIVLALLLPHALDGVLPPEVSGLISTATANAFFGLIVLEVGASIAESVKVIFAGRLPWQE